MKNSASKLKLWDDFNSSYDEAVEEAFQSHNIVYLLFSSEHGFSTHTEAGGNHIFPNAHELKRIEGWGNEFEEGAEWSDCLYDEQDYFSEKERCFDEWEIEDEECEIYINKGE